jgi:uracil-DNA glycosylase family 4
MAWHEAIPPRDVSSYNPVKHGARCDICPLKGNQYVPAMPPEEGKPKLVIVGEGPGRKEVLQRRPFVGVTGDYLNQELDELGIRREEAWVTNAAMCVGETDQDNARAAECCAPRLAQELADLPPEAPILALGKAATKSILGVKSILLARGFVWTTRSLEGPIESSEANIRKAERNADEEGIVEHTLKCQTLKARSRLADRTVLPMLHPTFAFIHNEGWAPIFHVDMKRAKRFLSGELTKEGLADNITKVSSIKGLKRGKRAYIVTDSVTEIDEIGDILGPDVGLDIETNATQPLSPLTAGILCVQISDGVRTLVIGPWDVKTHPEPLTRLLKKKRTIVLHNGYNFDQPALEVDGVDFDLSKIEDTLVAHHAFASHFPQRLDHVISVFLDASPWKIRFGRRGAEEKGVPPQHMDINELHHYGAVDAVLTILAWFAMQKDLDSERAVYEHDKLLGIQGKGLQVVGIRVDRKRRKHLSLGLKRRAASLKGRMRTLSGKEYFQPSRLGEVRRVLFKTLRAPMLNPTATGLASTSNATLEQIRTQGLGTLRRGPADTQQTSGPIQNKTRPTRAARFAEALLNWRVAVKIQSTYINAVVVHKDGRAHYNWRPYGTVSGRYSCRLQSCPRWSTAIEDRAREMYTASPASLLFYFDLSQAEARFAANLSGDANFIATCKGDVHTGNAKILFPQEDAQEMLARDPKGKNCPKHGEESEKGAKCNCGKPYRDIAKNAGFAVAYLAEAATVFAYLRAHGFPVELEAVEEMLGALKSSYGGYYTYVAENVAFCQKNGYLRTALMGRVRWFGFNPKPQEIANFPIQSGIADVMNTRLLKLQAYLAKECRGTRLIAQVHDAAIFDVPKKWVVWGTDSKGKPLAKGPVVEAIERTWAEPVRLEKSVVCREPREFLLPAEIKTGMRWSDFG